MAWRNLTVLLQLFVTFVREDCYRSGNSTVTQRFEFRETATAPKRRRTHAERDPGGLAPPTFVDDICQVRGLSGPELTHRIAERSAPRLDPQHLSQQDPVVMDAQKKEYRIERPPAERLWAADRA
jgi:hypothetical protein